MNLDLHCLSLLELLDLRNGAGDPAAAEHLQHCPRCRALMATLPATIAVPELADRSAEAHTASVRPAVPGRTRTGSLWRAAGGPDSDFSWVVALIGRSPDADDRLLVAPIAPTRALATDTDLVLEPQVLGYDAFIDVTNLGTLLRSQLLEPVGQLDRSVAQALVDLYRHTVSGGPPPENASRGLPVLDENDPRLLERAARKEALLELWRPALLLVEDARGPALSEVIAPYLEGADATWDRLSLIEETGVDSAHLTGFLSDRLELTDKTDILDLAAVIAALEIPREEAEPAVVASLWASEGGTRIADGPTLRMAARSRAGADEEATKRDLYDDQSRVDASAEARAREVDAYLAELRRALDELE